MDRFLSGLILDVNERQILGKTNLLSCSKYTFLKYKYVHLNVITLLSEPSTSPQGVWGCGTVVGEEGGGMVLKQLKKWAQAVREADFL